MGSIGIAIRRGISFHGLALNVSVSLEPFGWINPCGLRDVGITTLQRASGRKLDLAAVQREFKRQIKAVFNARLRPVNRDDINRWTTTEM
jgi:lipoate-protein ligase B